MSAQNYRDWWIDQVLAAPALTDRVRVALFGLYREMNDAGMVDMNVAELARKINRSDRKTIDRLSIAVESGFMTRVARGQKNGKSRFQATAPPGISSGPPGVRKTTAVNVTPGGHQDGSLHDGFQHEENPGQRDPRGSRRTRPVDTVNVTPGGHEEPAPSIGTARAHLKGDRTYPTAPRSGPADRLETEQKESINPDVQERQAARWLHTEYQGLTDFVVAFVITEAHARAARTGRPIRNLVPYLAAMRDPSKGQDEADLSTIIGAAMDAEEQRDRPAAPPPEFTLHDGQADHQAAGPTQRPLLGALPDPAPAEVLPAQAAIARLRAERGWRKTP